MHSRFVAVFLCVVLAAPVLGAHAATNTTGLSMPTVVVTATRDERDTHNTPHATSILGSDELRLEQAVRTVPESLGKQPSTMVQKTGHGQGSPYIRGFTTYRNLLMVDGVRLNNSVFRDGPNQYWNTVDPFGLSKMESVRGPASSLYGSDAIGGTLSVMTRGAGDLREGSDWDRRLYYRYASAENSHTVRGESIANILDDVTLTVGYTYKDFGDIEGGKDVGTQEKTGYSEYDWDAKLEWFLDDDSYLVLAHQDVRIDDAWRTHKTIYGIDWEGLSVGNEYSRILDQDRDLTYLQYHNVDAGRPRAEVHAGISHQLQEEERYRSRTGDRYDEQGFEVHTCGGFVSVRTPTRIGDLIWGAEAYHDEVVSFKNSLNADGSVKSSSIQGPVGR